LQILRRAYKFAGKHEPPKVARVPVFELDREDNARKEFYTSAQIDKIRAAASKEGPEWRCLIELAYALGWRRGELLGLLVSNVDLMAGTVRIDTSKNGEPREAVLTDRLKMFVQPLLGNRAPDDLVSRSRKAASDTVGVELRVSLAYRRESFTAFAAPLRATSALQE